MVTCTILASVAVISAASRTRNAAVSLRVTMSSRGGQMVAVRVVPRHVDPPPGSRAALARRDGAVGGMHDQAVAQSHAGDDGVVPAAAAAGRQLHGLAFVALDQDGALRADVISSTAAGRGGDQLVFRREAPRDYGHARRLPSPISARISSRELAPVLRASFRHSGSSAGPGRQINAVPAGPGSAGVRRTQRIPRT